MLKKEKQTLLNSHYKIKTVGAVGIIIFYNLWYYSCL